MENICVLVRVTFAMMKHRDQKQLEEVRLISLTGPSSKAVRAGTQAR